MLELFLFTFYWLILDSELGPFVTPFLALILHEYLFSVSLLRRWLLLFSPFFFYNLSCEIYRVVNRLALIGPYGPWWVVLLSFELRGSWATRFSELLGSLDLS